MAWVGPCPPQLPALVDDIAIKIENPLIGENGYVKIKFSKCTWNYKKDQISSMSQLLRIKQIELESTMMVDSL